MATGRIILNTPRYKGEFPFDMAEEPLTGLEWRWVKQISGYTLGSFMDGLEALDPPLLCAFATVALARNGRISEQDAIAASEELLRVPFDGQRIVFDAGEVEEDEQGPPAIAPATGPQPESTGASSSSTSDLSERLPSLIGAPG